MKQIAIKNCNDCPFKEHTGAFTKGDAKPCCGHSEVVKTKGSDCFNRVIPYRNGNIGDRTYHQPKGIPTWCPL